MPGCLAGEPGSNLGQAWACWAGPSHPELAKQDWSGLGWARLGWTGWVGLGWAGLGWAGQASWPDLLIWAGLAAVPTRAALGPSYFSAGLV